MNGVCHVNDQVEKKCAAIVGGGTMGTDIAAIFLSRGWNVHIVEPLESRWTSALQRVNQSAEQLGGRTGEVGVQDRKSTRLNSSHT